MSDSAGGSDDVDPFAPAEVRWRPVSPRLAPLRVLTGGLVLGVLALPGLIVAIWAEQPWVLIEPVLCLLGFAWAAVLAPRQVRAIGYAERDDDLLIRKGILLRELVVVPYGRMQYVDVQAGPLSRVFGLSTVQLHTASTGTDATIPGLVSSEAARLRDQLAARGQARMAGL